MCKLFNFFFFIAVNTMLFIISTLFHEQYGDLESHCESHGFLTPMNYMCFVITLENIFMIPTIISYICMLKDSQFSTRNNF